MTNRLLILILFIGFSFLLAGCLPDSGKISPQSLFDDLGKSEILPRAVEPNKFPALNRAILDIVRLVAIK